MDPKDGQFASCAAWSFVDLSRSANSRLVKLARIDDIGELGEDADADEIKAMTADDLGKLIDSFASDWVDDLYVEAKGAIAAYEAERFNDEMI